MEHGVERIRCDACAHEYLLVFSCKGRYFCPRCHAKRLAIWTPSLDTTLLGEIARVAARTVTAAIRTLTGERELAVGIVACLQTHGSRANWHPHLHPLVTDGGFRRDGTFIAWPGENRILDRPRLSLLSLQWRGGIQR